VEISINFKVLWDSQSEDSFPAERDLILKSCIHSGNAGDIIYSLPTVKELGANHYVINLCSDPVFGSLGGRSISFSNARALAPLLLKQPYIKRVTIVSSNLHLEFLDQQIEGVDFILDRFRLYEPFKHHLAITHAMAFGLYLNLYEKWLHVDSEKPDRNYIIVSLTPRYRSLPKEYWLDVLSGLDNVIAIGLPQEFHSMAGISAEFVTCADFLEMAKMIQGCCLFIGNPSLPYAIAEGLKVQRIVELHPEFQNAYPIGRSGYVAPSSIVEARDLIHRLISDSSMSALQYQNTTLLRKTVDLEAIIKDLETTLESKVNEILKLQNYIESMIKEKDQYIESLKEAMDSKDKYAKDLERNLESIIPEKDQYIESLLNALDAKAKEITDLNTSIVQKNEDIERLNSELNALKNMYIYRLLKKFKFVKMSPTDLK
jgi:hypothetical protein